MPLLHIYTWRAYGPSAGAVKGQRLSIPESLPDYFHPAGSFCDTIVASSPTPSLSRRATGGFNPLAPTDVREVCLFLSAIIFLFISALTL